MTPQIPTLSLQRLQNAGEQAKLINACEDWGFFALTEHGLSMEQMSQVLELSQQFFRQPREAKQRIERTKDNSWGFYDKELTKNTRDWKEIWDFGPDENKSKAQWPQIDQFEPVMQRFYNDCSRLSVQLLQCLAQVLQTPAADLRQEFTDHTSFLRLNYYPVCPAPASAGATSEHPDGHLGISHHTDAGALTVLLRDAQPGLQVLHNNHWHTIAPQSNALIINIGDVVQVWSNDRFRAPLHRVLANSNATRFSAAFFYNPNFNSNYAPLSSQTSQANPPHYRAINWGEFRSARSDGDYGNYGQEVQISDFKLDGR